MATKPMPRIRAGASGSPVTPISTGKKPNLEKTAKIVTVRRNRNSDSSIDFNKDSMDPVFKSRTSLNDNHEATTTAVAEPTCFGTKSKPENHISDPAHGPPKELKLTLENCNKMSLTEEATNLMQNSMVDVQKCSDGNSEISRLKELMMLQVSLISRQQDLLKLRDKEIMHLKANNQSFKCRLERMERRISLSKRNWKESEPPSTQSQPNHDGKRKRPDPDHKNEVKAKEIQPPTAPIPPAQTPAPTNQQVDSVNPVVNKPINACSTPTKTTPKEENTSFTANTSEPSHNSS
uniref:Uncharacterized protein n=1 Tax=Ciona savignyi TaxID=51511 RepID=H2Y4F2_CIOSA